ncbi:hypothetical protein B4N84_06845 [Flavobacterium sp. IR1]|nr:hypothetical protein B4N84_06845 [Flavobacterium sp. IR1]
MKKYISIIALLLLFGSVLQAQTFSDDNFIYTVSPKKAVQSGQLNTLTKDEINQNVGYFDGLGRPVQTISVGQGGNGAHIVTPKQYDTYGREIKEYLPYPVSGGGTNYSRIDPLSAVNAAISFYGSEKYENTSNPYSEKLLEPAPVNRVLKQAAPGNPWAMNSGHEIKFDYKVNDANEVKLFNANTRWDAGTGLFEISFEDAGFYDANELYKTITYDENTAATPSETAGSTVEFKDKQGQVVLKRTYQAGTKHDTYYVYDGYGNLTYVIPPKADGAINNDVLNGLCYQYKYDSRNRLAEKKLPGKQWEFIVYDKLDRPVATGPALSPFQDDTAVGWLITKYDVYNRPVYTGWQNQTANSSSRKALQDAQNLATNVSESKQTSGTIDGVAVTYTNSITPTNFKLLTVSYYDDYSFPNARVLPTSVEGQPTLTNVKMMTTGSWTRVPTTALAMAGETNTIFYDDKSRPVRSYTQNYLGGYTTTDSKLDFTGKTLYTITKHKRTTGDTELIIREDFTYSPQDRLLTHTHQINGGAVQLMAENTYDEMGQLTSKRVGGNTGNPLQKVDFSYNIRGWLSGINNTASLQQNTDPLDLFTFKINYNTIQTGITGVKPLYNGNIAETYWRTGADNMLRAYGYKYDNLNRLNEAIYHKNELTTNAYDENILYDKNGNILSLNRNGDIDPQAGVIKIDDLVYTYLANSNQLAGVLDTTNNSSGFSDANKTGDDYSYDENGNLIEDKNKSITAITYNHLNLPKKIIFGTGNRIEYLYSGNGEKVEKIVTENNTVTNTNYLQSFQYKDNVLEFFPTAEGYVQNENGVLGYVFQYKDHLGNVRVSYKRNAQNVLEIVEENNYYAFGLLHKGYNHYVPGTIKNLYKYNGKELQDELGLNAYDYGARFYDPATGRWYTVDAMAEKYSDMSPYNYALNNPVMFIDPDGNEVEMCCEGLKGFLVGIVDNIASMNIRSKYEGQDFENGVRAADIVSAIGGAYLAAKGGGDIAAGVAGLEASATVTAASGGLAVEATGPSAALSGALIGVGTLEVYTGTNIFSNAMNNLKEGNSTENSNSTEKSNGGRSGKQKRLEELGNDSKTSSADRGWIKQEKNSIARKSTRESKDGTLKPQKNIRNPPGKDLAHPYKKPAREGNSYKDAKLKNTADHRTEHKIHGYK